MSYPKTFTFIIYYVIFWRACVPSLILGLVMYEEKERMDAPARYSRLVIK